MDIITCMKLNDSLNFMLKISDVKKNPLTMAETGLSFKRQTDINPCAALDF